MMWSDVVGCLARRLAAFWCSGVCDVVVGSLVWHTSYGYCGHRERENE